MLDLQFIVHCICSNKCICLCSVKNLSLGKTTIAVVVSPASNIFMLLMIHVNDYDEFPIKKLPTLACKDGFSKSNSAAVAPVRIDGVERYLCRGYKTEA